LQLGNDFIEFKARFGGKPREIMVPVGRVIAIYARENGQGMAFPVPVDSLVDGPFIVGCVGRPTSSPKFSAAATTGFSSNTARRLRASMRWSPTMKS
jgi:stringent starvation protein B